MPRPSAVEIMTFGFRGFPGVQGGIETHVENLAPRIVKLGYGVTACVRSPYSPPQGLREWKGVRLLRIWTVRHTYLETILHSLLCVLAAAFRRPDIVHIHGVGPAIYAPLARLLGLQVVVTHHGPDYERDKWGWAARTILRVGEALGMRFASKRIAISQGIAQRIEAKYGKSSVVIPNGIVVPDLPTRTDKVVDLGLEPQRYVVTVGRLVPEKRQLDLLRAFARAQPEGWKLAIVGQVDHENEYAKTLAAEAASTPNVVMTGFQHGEALRQLYAHAGLFVLPSSHEGMPIALLEALSYGLPVLVSDIPANLEVLDDPRHTFRMGDIADLSTKMAALIGSRADNADREAARRDWARRYDWDHIAEQTAAVYAELVGLRRTAAVSGTDHVQRRTT